MEPVRLHIRVTAALMIREMSTRYGSKPGGYIWALVEPIAYIALLTLVFSAIARLPALGNSFSLFFASGYLPFMFFHSVQAFIAGGVKANRALLNYPIVSPIDVLVSRYIVQLLTSTVVAVLVLALVVLEDGVTISLDFGVVVASLLSASLLGAGIGMANASLFARSALYEQVYGIISRPLMMVSGVFFLPESMPHPYGDLLLLNPIAHVITWFRRGIYPEYRAHSLDIFYVLVFTSVTLMVGLMLFTYSSQQLREDRL